MTSEGLVDMFEGDSADTCAGKITASVNGGPSGGSRVHRLGREDPYRASGIGPSGAVQTVSSKAP
jgi:hypothetical protein